MFYRALSFIKNKMTWIFMWRNIDFIGELKIKITNNQKMELFVVLYV